MDLDSWRRITTLYWAFLLKIMVIHDSIVDYFIKLNHVWFTCVWIQENLKLNINNEYNAYAVFCVYKYRILWFSDSKANHITDTSQHK